MVFQRLPSDRLYTNPFLYLRTPNTNRPIVDLFSMKTTYSILTTDCCRYDLENKQSGKINLIQKKMLLLSKIL